MAKQYAVEHYLTEDGTDIFAEWFRSLRDHDAKARIAVRLDRVEQGNFGDCKLLEHGVWELRIDYGPGYRMYYCLDGRAVVLLLCGGDKTYGVKFGHSIPFLLLCGGDKTSRKADIKRAKAFEESYGGRKKP
ncbi:MAG: type II toxin-antitoxin system RelE/ParE family toxin [Desulfovibrio sp.]|jgi:putative addiction module killer protein|nr:type II toxin-antitoxin system RelE/ParE family toxin [Desulfovibrio sp.]